MAEPSGVRQRKAASGPPKGGPRIPEGYAPNERDAMVVRVATLAGMDKDRIAKLVNFEQGGLSVRALEHIYRRELEAGGDALLTRVARNMVRIALGSGKEAVTAGIFILTSKGDWKNPVARGGGGKPGEAAPVDPNQDMVFTLRLSGSAALDEGRAANDGRS